MIFIHTLILFALLQVLGIKLIDQFSRSFSQNKFSFRILYSPIVLFHEIGHLIFAILLFQSIHSFSISIFRKDPGPLGSVAIKPSDSISSSLVAIGPLIFSLSIIIICQLFIYPQTSGLMKIIYFIFLIFFTQVGILSKQDWKIGAKGIFISILIFSLLFLFANSSEKKIVFDFIQNISRLLNYIYLILCIINLTLVILIKSISNAYSFHTSSKN